MLVSLASEIPLTIGYQTYKCIFGNYVADATLQADLKSLKCLTPPASSPFPVSVDITINQGLSCDGDKCCSILDSCFVGSLSNLPRSYMYYDGEPLLSEGAILFTNTETHAHIFSHEFHELSNLQHAHIIYVRSEYLLARSVTVSRSCNCLRGDFDCICGDTYGNHSHVFVHSHAFTNADHNHIIMVQSPALGTLPNSSNSPSEYLHNPMLSLYGLGAYDSIPAVIVDSILDSSVLEDAVDRPSGFSFFTYIPGGYFPAVSNTTVAFDGTSSIRNPPNPGLTDSYEVEIIKPAYIPQIKCQLSAAYCGRVLQRNQAAPSYILNTLYQYASLVPTIALTGVNTTVAIEIVNSVQYNAGSSLVIMFPDPLAFSDFPSLLLCHAHLNCVDLTDLIGASTSVRLVRDDSNIRCVGNYSCVQVKFKYGISAFSTISFNLTGLQMPLETVPNPLMIILFTLNSMNITIESPKYPISFPPILPSPLALFFASTSDLVAGDTFDLHINFSLSNPWVPGDSIHIIFPSGFNANDAFLSFLEISVDEHRISFVPSVEFLETAIEINFLDRLLLAKDAEFRFKLSGIQCSVRPGAAGGSISVQILSHQLKLISLSKYDLGQIFPAHLNSAFASIFPVTTGAQSTLNFSFVTAVPIWPGSDLIISLPSGFALCSDSSNAWKLRVSFNKPQAASPGKTCIPSICPTNVLNCTVPACTPAISTLASTQFQVSWGTNCSEVAPGTLMSFQTTYIRNALIEGPYGTISAYIKSTGRCDPCAQENDILWSQGLTDFYLKTSSLNNINLNLSSVRTGDNSTISLSFSTANYLSPRSWIVIDIAQYFQINAQIWKLTYSVFFKNNLIEKRNLSSATCCQSGSNLSNPGLCCRAAQIIFFQTSNSISQGSVFYIQLVGISNKMTSGVSSFQVRTALSLWNFVDRAVVSMMMYPTIADGTVVPFSYIQINADGTERTVASNKMIIGAVGSFSFTFKIVHSLPPDGGLQIQFSDGFSLTRASLVGSIQGLTGNVRTEISENKISFIRLNGTAVQSNYQFRFNISGIGYPNSLESAYVIVRSLAQIGDPACDTCMAWQIMDCKSCFSYGTVDETLQISPGIMNPGTLGGLSVSIRPVGAMYLFLNVFVSVDVYFVTAGNLSINYYVQLQLPEGYRANYSVMSLNSTTGLRLDIFGSTQDLLSFRVTQLIPSGSVVWISFANVLSPEEPLNSSIFTVTTGGECGISNCILEEGAVEASVLIPDPSSFILNPSLASEQASVGALAAAPTKNTPLSVTLIWNFTTSDYEQISNEPSYTAYITSNCTVKDIYTVTSSTGTYNLQFFESAYQGSVLAFYLNANIHGRNVFFGMSTVRVMNVSQPPVNLTASLTEPLQVSLTWASPIDQGFGIGYENILLYYIIEIFIASSQASSLRRKTVSCCQGRQSCCGLSSFVLNSADSCSQSGSIVPCISADFEGRNVSFRINTVNAAGEGNYGFEQSVLVIGMAQALNISAKTLSVPNSSQPGIYVTWTNLNENFNLGYGAGNSEQNLLVLKTSFFELNIFVGSDTQGSLISLPLSTTEYWIKSGLLPGRVYSFQIRVNTGIFPGEWSNLQSVTAVQRPSIASITAVSILSELMLGVQISMELAANSSSSYLDSIGFNVVQFQSTQFKSCCNSQTPWIACDDENNVEQKSFSVSLKSKTLVFVGMKSEGDQEYGLFSFNATDLIRGRGYSFQVQSYNSAGTSLEWSLPSETTQCQGQILGPLNFSDPVLENQNVLLHWNTISPVEFPDFTYRLRRLANPQYPFDSSGQYNDRAPSLTQPIHAEEVFTQNTQNVQNIFTYGARDIDSVKVDGNLLVAVTNYNPYSPFNIEAGKSMFEASMIIQLDSDTGSFGGDCAWDIAGSCTQTGPLCAAYGQNPLCFRNDSFVDQSILMNGTGAKQLIQTFGAIKSKFMTLDGDTFLMVLNTKVPTSYACMYNFPPSSSNFAYEKVQYGPGSSYLEYVKVENGYIFGKPIMEFITSCEGIEDTVTCGAGVCRPASFSLTQNLQTRDPGSNGSYSYLYKYDNNTNLFLEHSLYLFQKPTHLEYFSALSCIPSAPCISCELCVSESDGCTCNNYSYMVVCDETAPSKIYIWNSSNSEFKLLQQLNIAGARASKFFSAYNNSLLFVAIYNADSSVDGNENSYLYRLQNGLFVAISSVQTNGAYHVESFERNGRHYVVVCNGIYDPSDDETQSTCTPNSTCPVLYEVNSNLVLRYVQSFEGFGLNQALSSTAFSRKVGGVSDNYLLFAVYRSIQNNQSSSSAYSRLYKWITTANVWGAGELLYDQFALVRLIYTNGARIWSLIDENSSTLAVANDANFIVNTSVMKCNEKRPPCAEGNTYSCFPLPCSTSACSYRSLDSCCGIAGGPCYASQSENGEIYTPFFNNAIKYQEVGISTVFFLPEWPTYNDDLLYNCTSNSFMVSLPQTTSAQADWLYYGASTIFTVFSVNKLASSQLTSVSVRPLGLPGSPMLLSAEAGGNGSILVKFLPPVDDGEFFVPGRSPVKMKFKVMIISQQIDIFVNCSVDPCILSEITSQTELEMPGFSSGHIYSVIVFAINAAGQGPASNIKYVLTFGPPGKVRDLNVSQSLGPSSFMLSWRRPDDLGSGVNTSNTTSINFLRYKLSIFAADSSGAPDTVPIVRQEISSVSALTQLIHIPDDLDQTVGFTKGAVYFFAVLASNIGGDGDAQWVSACALDVSSPPTLSSAVLAGPGNISLKWTAPADTGAGVGQNCFNPTTDIDSGKVNSVKIKQNDIWLYIIEVSENNEFTPLDKVRGSYLMQVPPTSTSTYVDMLKIGTVYYFRIFAETVSGTSLPSQTKTSIVGNVPSPPQNLVVIPSSPLALTISFRQPADTGLGLNGGFFALSTYEVDVSKDILFSELYQKIVLPANTTILVLNELSEGIALFFRVRASNIVGAGKFSKNVICIPLNIPSVPTGLVARAGQGLSLVFEWKVIALMK